LGTVNVQEPEVKDLKQAGRPAAAILPKPDVRAGRKFTPRPMFADSILEFGNQKKRQAFATATSFILNCLAIGVILIMPLVLTESLPKAQLLTLLVVPPPPPPPPAADQLPRVMRRIQTDLLNGGQLLTPTEIPQTVPMIGGEEAPPMPAGSGGVIGGLGGVPSRRIGGVIGSIVSSTSNLAPVPTFVPPTPQPVRISQGVTKGLLMRKIAPAYPPLERAARVQGDVVLSAVLDANGQITNLQLVSGHPWLVPAAMAAVKQWRYKPYLLDGQPVEVETTITVTFSLSS
jgi:protein TonB